MLLSMKLTDISPAIALTPLDGRYHKQTAPLVEYMSEPALNRERMRVEVEWMILLANGFEGNGNQTIVPGVKPLTDDEQAYLRSIPENFGAEGIAQHAAYEAKTHHDVKAVEYYIDDQLEKAADVLGHDTQLTGLKTLVHFACTSEDINNLSIARCVKNGVEQVWLPAAQAIGRPSGTEGRRLPRQGHAVADPWTACHADHAGQGTGCLCVSSEPSAQQGQGPGISR